MVLHVLPHYVRSLRNDNEVGLPRCYVLCHDTRAAQ